MRNDVWSHSDKGYGGGGLGLALAILVLALIVLVCLVGGAPVLQKLVMGG